MSGASTLRLSRLLAMVPWLLRRQGVSLEEAARHFGITEEQLVKDLQLLFVCGTPGHMPDDLIEAEWESGEVYVDNAEAISRPLRLAPDEAVALLVGLRTLAEVPGLHDRGPVESALAKLSAAAGDALPGTVAPLTVDLSVGAEEETLRAAREALRTRRRLRLRYLVPSRDEATDRDVDPMRVTNVASRWYLEGWCHRAEDVRMFRVDRVAGIEVLDVDGTPPPEAVSREDDGGPVFTPSGDEPVVTLEVDGRGRWVAEYYPVEDVEELPGGHLRVRLRTANPRWLPRLVLRLGGAGRIVDPPELAAESVRLAEAALAAYADESVV
jgi:predicted DNA-binding transcriptional regulator YafY